MGAAAHCQGVDRESVMSYRNGVIDLAAQSSPK